jgi:outer membrane protein assembly factor BamE (lipoprotein component of BamABCDE complex)
MNKFIPVLLVGFIFLAGCTTITGYHKAVTVEKDKDGNIIKTTIVEEMHQPNLQKEVQEFKYINQ